MTGGEPVRIVIADDQAMVRAGLATLLDGQPGLTVVGQAGTGEEAVQLTRKVAAGRGADGHQDAGAQRARRHPAHPLRHRGPGARPVRVVVLTTYDLDEYVYEALRAGASGFLLKHAPPEELLLGVRAAADGGALLSPQVTRRLVAEFAARRPAARRPPPELGPAHPARAGGTRPGRLRPVQHRDRRSADRVAEHREDPPGPHPGQAGAAGPGPGGRVRVRARPGRAGRRELKPPPAAPWVAGAEMPHVPGVLLDMGV